MDALTSFLVPLILIALFVFISYLSFLRGGSGGPISITRRESSRPRVNLGQREAPSVTGVRRYRQQEREREAALTWNTARDEERLELSIRPESTTDGPTRRRRERVMAERLPPVRTGRTPTPGRRPRPALLATPGAAREAFLVMELLRPPVTFRDTEASTEGDTDVGTRSHFSTVVVQ
jgi:hypothetical protein